MASLQWSIIGSISFYISLPKKDNHPAFVAANKITEKQKKLPLRVKKKRIPYLVKLAGLLALV
jgi:hypothetical protein